jgi:tetratricopeptide repeat protein 21B
VATHEYHRAVEFYESAIRELNKAQQQHAGGSGGSSEARKGGGTSSGNSGAGSDLVVLSHDLSKLYIKLGRAESSIRVLNNVVHDIGANDVPTLRQDVTTLLLLSQVQRSTQAEDAALDSLRRAYSCQKELILKLRSATSAATSSEVMEKEKCILSDLSTQLGDHYAASKEVAVAEQSYQEAIQQNPQNTKAMYGLAKIYFDRNDKDMCQAQCVKIITAVPTAEAAAVLLSEVLFYSEQPENAVNPLQALLKLTPNNYVALEKAISLLRRAGQLEQVLPLLKAAETNDRRCQSHAGYHYCQGLYARFTNDIGKAILEFNLSRKDEVWGPQALTHMVELYLNPDQEGAWEEKESGPLDDATRANIAAAEELLRELRPKAK